MCPKPSIPAPQAQTQYQKSRKPVYPDSGDIGSGGRKSTILTGSEGVADSTPTQKKTLLGQ